MEFKKLKEPIKIWHFKDAPKKYRKLSTNGGDEDYLAFIPEHYKNEYFPFLEEGTNFGCFSVDKVEVNGGIILIGSHS